MNPNTRHLVFLDLLYNCLELREVDARRLAGQPLEIITYPKDCPDKRLAGYRITHQAIAYNELYFQCVRSVPGEERKLILCDYLARRHDLQGVAGFYLQGGRWRLNLTGTLVRPYRDERKRITGLFTYRNYVDSQPGLLTSEGFYKGSPAIQPIGHEMREVA